MRKMLIFTIFLSLVLPAAYAGMLSVSQPVAHNDTAITGNGYHRGGWLVDSDFDCDPDSIWSQPFEGIEVYTVSDMNHENDAVSADDFNGLTMPITAIEWWGGELQCCWSSCSKTNLDFIITFYEAGSLPGAVVHSETVTATRTTTSEFIFDNPSLGPVLKYSAEFASPVSIVDGWVSVQAVDSGACWFLWADAGFTSGTQEFVQDVGTGWAPGGYDADLAFCLIAGDADPHIRLEPEVSDGIGPADTVITHTFTLRNRSGMQDTIDLDISGASWTTTVTSDNPVTLPDGGNADVTVDVVIPPGATPPDSDSSTLTATGQSSGLNATAVLNTEVGDYPQIDIDPTSFNVNVPIDDTLNETMTIWNNGTDTLTWSMSVSEPGSRDIGDWQNVTPAATPVQWPASTFAEGKLFVIGGFTDTTAGTLSNVIQIYETATGTWTDSAPMNTPIFAAVAEYYQGNIYVVGGYASDAFTATNQVQIYDIETDTWTTGATMPTARGGNVGGIIGGMIYSLGGAPGGSFPEENVAYGYDIAANSWTTMNDGPVSGGGFGIILGGGTAYEGKIYAGGHFLSAHNQFYEFDPAGNGTWTTLATPPAAFGNLTPSFIGLETENIILGVGAGNDWNETGTTFAYDPAANTWTNLNKPMTVSALGGAAGAGGGQVYFYGGTTGDGPVTPAPFMMNTYADIEWVVPNPTSGTITPGNSTTVDILFDAAATDGVGTYEAWLVVNSNDPMNSPWNVPVVMNVFDGPTPTPPEPTATPTPEPTPTPEDPTPTPGPPEGDVIWIGTDYCGDTGDQIEVEIWMSNESNAVDAFTMRVEFDNTMLDFVEGIEGDLDPGWTMFGANEADPGVITVAGFSLPPAEIPAGSEGVLAILIFDVTCNDCDEGDTSDLIPFDLLDDIAGYDAINGMFTFICPDPDPTPTPTPTPDPDPTPTPGPPEGDVLWIGTEYCGDTGDQIEVEVWMMNETVVVDAFTMAVLFDNTMLDFVEGIAGDLDPGWTMFGANEADPGVITVAGFSLPPAEIPAGSEGVLAILVFDVTCNDCDEGDTSELIPDNLRDDIADFDSINGMFTFICPEDPTPTPEPTETPVPPTNTPTNTPTSIPPTFTPTATPTQPEEPTPTPTQPEEPTPTPEPDCDWFGTRLELSQEDLYRAGDEFWLRCHICVDAMVTDVPTAVLLGVYGEFWFWPGWEQDFDLMMMDFEPGLTTFYGLEPFIWPTVEGHVEGLEFYAAMLTPDMTNIFGDEFGYVVFGYTDQ